MVIADYLGGTSTHWQQAYNSAIRELEQLHHNLPRHGIVWPNNWFSASDGNYGHHRNHWRHFDAVVAELHESTQAIIHEHGCDINTVQGIREWRTLMMPSIAETECFSCGQMCLRRVTILTRDADVVEYECGRCMERVAANHDQMFADYLATLSPSSRDVVEREQRLRKRRRISESATS